MPFGSHPTILGSAVSPIIRPDLSDPLDGVSDRIPYQPHIRQPVWLHVGGIHHFRLPHTFLTSSRVHYRGIRLFSDIQLPTRSRSAIVPIVFIRLLLGLVIVPFHTLFLT